MYSHCLVPRVGPGRADALYPSVTGLGRSVVVGGEQSLCVRVREGSDHAKMQEGFPGADDPAACTSH